jgi:hypothetical protein
VASGDRWGWGERWQVMFGERRQRLGRAPVGDVYRAVAAERGSRGDGERWRLSKMCARGLMWVWR